jgi:anti-anti-sigma regulatory factor
MTVAYSNHPVQFHLVTTNRERGLKLVDVEGELGAAVATRWSGLFNSVVNEGATGIAVDLRGCRSVDPICLSVLLATSAVLKERGGGGVKLVTSPGSSLDRRLRALASDELPAFDSASGALGSLGDGHR